MNNPIRSSMLRRSRPYAIGILAAVALAGSACSDGDKTAPTQPTALTTFSTPAETNVSFSTVSNTVSAVPVSNSLCPAIAPFRAPIVVLVSSNGAANLTVTQMQLRFTDTSGIQMPPVTLAAPMPITQFGDALQFQLSLGVGCGAGRFGTAVIVVDARDGNGRRHSGSVTVSVR